tara:strand:- start:2697 stop:3359 length:663 start_codon:yes stop_codon:yes gene_type:complete
LKWFCPDAPSSFRQKKAIGHITANGFNLASCMALKTVQNAASPRPDQPMTETNPNEAIEPALQQNGMVPPHGLTEAIHIGETDLPFVDAGDGTLLQLLQVDLNQGLWVLRTRFPAGHRVSKHYHTGPVFAVTFSGSWCYEEYPEYKNTAGSYLYEPAHSLHTLVVGDKGADIWFSIYGANVNVDTANNVTGVTDAQSILAAYQGLCAAQGLNCEKLIIKQ